MSESHHFGPAAPLTAALDRGPTRYFHGRKRVQNNFKALLSRAAKAKSGTTFLIQGAPGAGKTALVYECEKHASARGWKVAEIGVLSLCDPHEMLDSLGLGDKNRVTEKSMQFGLKYLFRRGYRSSRPKTSVENVLKDGKQPLLLILDEAQRLSGNSAPPRDQRHAVADILEAIHNGMLGKPVILLAAGLQTTQRAFCEYGVARFVEDCLVDLGALCAESERAVIRDWLKKEGGTQGDTTAWIDAITRETHGWPQHIQCYSISAADQLKANDGVMTPGRLGSVLAAGRESRKVYYKQRVVDFRGDQLRCLARSIETARRGVLLEYRDIVSSLAQEYGEEGARQLFKRFEEKGLLAKIGTGYAVPIPPMEAWLKDEYAR